MTRKLSLIDELITHTDKALRTLVPDSSTANRETPSIHTEAKDNLSEQQRKHIAGLMRINHTGEVCAQALYQGQALTAKQAGIKQSMQHAAEEEVDHLVWCEQRLDQLGSRTSLLNPLFYAGSFTLGALAGIAGDKWSLGFVAATEDQVCEHLEDHLAQIDDTDPKSKAILEQMLIDEKAHQTTALEAGGHQFSNNNKKVMRRISKIMTTSTYYI